MRINNGVQEIEKEAGVITKAAVVDIVVIL